MRAVELENKFPIHFKHRHDMRHATASSSQEKISRPFKGSNERIIITNTIYELNLPSSRYKIREAYSTSAKGELPRNPARHRSQNKGTLPARTEKLIQQRTAQPK
ncbi:hypothetical protein M758_12G062400 [Ceratodon purpureus]|nr:hypothetical protein M758_12G062400 [Ceratodon purpureus]